MSKLETGPHDFYSFLAYTTPWGVSWAKISNGHRKRTVPWCILTLASGLFSTISYKYQLLEGITKSFYEGKLKTSTKRASRTKDHHLHLE